MLSVDERTPHLCTGWRGPMEALAKEELPLFRWTSKAGRGKAKGNQ